MPKSTEGLALELRGVAALLNAFTLQYKPHGERLSEEESERAIFTVQEELMRIADDLVEIWQGAHPHA